jgi:biopolymer transport protein TolR
MAALQRRGGGRRALAEINVVPYIDVMLVLLIIFMVTAPLIAPNLVKLPSVGRASRAPDTLVEVDLKADRTLSVKLHDPNGRPGNQGLNEQPITLEQLPQTVAVLAQQAGFSLQTIPVLIAADRDVRYDLVMEIISRLKLGGVQRVGLAVQASGESR